VVYLIKVYALVVFVVFSVAGLLILFLWVFSGAKALWNIHGSPVISRESSRGWIHRISPQGR